MGFAFYCINLRIIASFARLTIGILDSIYIAQVAAFAKDSGVKHLCYLIKNPISRGTQRRCVTHKHIHTHHAYRERERERERERDIYSYTLCRAPTWK